MEEIQAHYIARSKRCNDLISAYEYNLDDNEFETVWLLTGGGPNGTTEVMNVYSYKTAMRSMMLGRGIAVAVLAMPVLMILISILTRRMLPEGE